MNLFKPIFDFKMIIKWQHNNFYSRADMAGRRHVAMCVYVMWPRLCVKHVRERVRVRVCAHVRE